MDALLPSLLEQDFVVSFLSPPYFREFFRKPLAPCHESPDQRHLELVCQNVGQALACVQPKDKKLKIIRFCRWYQGGGTVYITHGSGSCTFKQGRGPGFVIRIRITDLIESGFNLDLEEQK